MTPTQSPTPGTEREAFEAWFRSAYHSRLDRNMPDASYNDPAAHSKWEAWQARAALSAPPLKQEAEAVSDAEIESLLNKWSSIDYTTKRLITELRSLLGTASQPPSSQGEPDMAKDAARYRWLRQRHWDDSNMCVVVDPKNFVRLGSYCPSGNLLDDRIDSAMKGDQP